jgi:hypothetical protein
MAKLNEYDLYIGKVFSSETFISGSELSKLIQNKFNLADAYSRKIIERAVGKNIIQSSAPITFGKGQFIYFSNTQKLSKDTLKLYCKDNRPPIYRLLEALDDNDGIISFYEALKITASPIEKNSSKIDSLDDIINDINKLQLLKFITDRNNVKYIVYENINDEKLDRIVFDHYNKIKLDASFTIDILEWLSKSNLIVTTDKSFRSKHQPSVGAFHNNLIWDALGYTKTTGINPISSQLAKEKEKQTLVVLDIVISRNYQQYDLDGFLSRIQINLNSVSTGKRKVLPIIIYKDCSTYLLNKIKSLGFIAYDIGSIYGSNIFHILNNISKIQLSSRLLENEEFETTIVDTLETIKNSGQENQLSDLKGTLFEVMLFQLLKQQYPSAEIIPNYYYSRKVEDKETGKEKKEGYEYDYIIKSSNPKEIIVVELKGYHAKYKIPLGDYETKNTVKWFFNRTFSFLREKYKKDIEEGYIYKGVYITSSQFEEDALIFLDKINNNNKCKPRNLDVYYNREKLLNLFEENDYKSLKNIIDKFY